MSKFSWQKGDKLAAILGKERVKFNESLARHTYFKIGGPADIFFTATSADELKLAVQAAGKVDIPYTILGGGSNVLVRDKGIRGLVIKNRADKISLVGFTGRVKESKAGVKAAVVKAESGALVNQLVRFSLEESLGGLEEFLGIPGTVEGAIYNNSHHLGKLIGDMVYQVMVIGVNGEEKTYLQVEMNFDYDYSRVQKSDEVIIWASFQLKPGEKIELWAAAEQALKRRRETQPLEMSSSGCMFKNIGRAKALQFHTPNEATAAGFLIDKAGLKGKKIGKAEISSKHANFIVNLGGAFAQDVIDLSNYVINEVRKKFGVTLEREVFIIGEE